MDKSIRKVTDFGEKRAETYRYWESRSPAANGLRRPGS